MASKQLTVGLNLLIIGLPKIVPNSQHFLT
jgi:hypothetical protein